MRLLIISCRKRAAHYVKSLEQQGVAFDLLCEINLVTQPPYAEREYSGALIDQAILLDARQGDESLLELLKSILPTLDIQARPRSLRDDTEDLKLETFLKACHLFPSRSVRLQDRVSIKLSTLISTDPSFVSPRQSTTLNLSKSGCLLTNPPRLATGDKLWISFVDLDDPSPILCEIRRFSKPQIPDQRPEIGVRFIKAKSSQLEKLQYLILEEMITSSKQPLKISEKP